jgi:ribonuclease H / adenosylcobalamin/alpha-ribazole phosphatase
VTEQPAQGADRVLLVRHGATAHTAERRFSGCTGANPQLSPTGRRQARLLADELRRAGPVSAVVCSPVRRAQETAASVGEALGLTPSVDEDWREIDFGDWEGRTVEEVRRRWADELDAWRAEPHRLAPGGEAVADVADRVRRALAGLTGPRRSAGGGTVVVVSHLYPVRLAVLEALTAPLEAVHRMEHEPTAVSELRRRDGVLALHRYNDSRHLGAGSGPDGGPDGVGHR